MNKSMLLGVLMGVGGATAGGALASYAVWNSSAAKSPEAANNTAQAAVIPAPHAVPQQGFADVLAVDPVTRTSTYPQQKCHTRQVVHRRPAKDSEQLAGTVLGGVIGGVLGHQVGKGKGRKVATVAGAIAGGYAGNRVQKNMQENDTYTTSEQRCTTVTRSRQKTVAYDVTYRWNGALTTVRMKKRPGDRLAINNGEVVLSSNGQHLAYD